MQGPLWLSSTLRNEIEDALREAREDGGTFAAGAPAYMIALDETPDGADISEPHTLDDVLELWFLDEENWDESGNYVGRGT